MYSTFFIGVLYFQHVLGFDPIVTGLAFLPQTLMVAVMSAGLTARIMGQARAEDHRPRRAWWWWPSGWRCSSRPVPARPTSPRSSRRCC